MATQAFPTQGPVARSSTVMARGSGGAPFAAKTATVDEDVVLSGVSGGLILLPLTMAPALVVPDFTVDSEAAAATHSWLKVEWSEAYLPTAATIITGTEWPETVLSVADRYLNIPLAYVDEDGALVQIPTSHIMLHRGFGPAGGMILAPAAL